jgi:NAD(P)-dependent dehydrogenase (short-subunit alcohol dehydrogenase family)
MEREFEGRVSLVTAAAGAGIGRATARRLAQGGAAVAVTDAHGGRTAETTEALVAEFGDHIAGYPLDVADRSRVDAVLARVSRDLGPLDILVNNAAINIAGPLSSYRVEDWQRVMDVDLNACFYLVRQVLPGMMERRRGVIVNVASVAGWLGGRDGEGPYAAAKAALLALTRSVAAEGGPCGVRCNAVAPGLIGSRCSEEDASLQAEIERTPLRRQGRPEEVASCIAFLASDRSSFVTGEAINVSGGWYMRP